MREREDLDARLDCLFRGEEASAWTPPRRLAVRHLLPLIGTTPAAVARAAGVPVYLAGNLLDHPAFAAMGPNVRLSQWAEAVLAGPATDPLAGVRRVVARATNLYSAREAYAHAVAGLALDQTRRDEAADVVRIRIAH